MLAHALQGPPRRRHRAQRVGGTLVGGQHLARLLGRRAQGVGEPEPLLLRGEVHVLAGLRVDRLDLGQAVPEQVGLAGALAGAAHHLVELTLHGPEP